MEREWAGGSGAVAEQSPVAVAGVYMHVPAAFEQLADDASTVDQRDREIPQSARVGSQPAWERHTDSLWFMPPARIPRESGRLDKPRGSAVLGMGRLARLRLSDASRSVGLTPPALSSPIPQPACEHAFAMTSDGNAITRLHRAIANPRASATQIRAIVAELPGPVALEDALAILLALLDREPETFPRAGARWGGRLVLERRLPLVDAQLTLAALAALPGPAAGAGAEALIELSERYGLRRVDELVGDWLRKR